MGEENISVSFLVEQPSKPNAINSELLKIKIHKNIVSSLKDQVNRLEITGLLNEAIYKMKCFNNKDHL